LHRIAEFRGSPRWKLNGNRPARVFEIVDVDPISRFRSIPSRAFQDGLDDVLHAAAGRTDDKQIEAGFVHPRAELDGPERPLLSCRCVYRRQFRSGLEGEDGGIGRTIEPVRGEWGGYGTLRQSVLRTGRGRLGGAHRRRQRGIDVHSFLRGGLGAATGRSGRSEHRNWAGANSPMPLLGYLDQRRDKQVDLAQS